MSDGISDANRSAEKVSRVEQCAEALACALLRTGDPVFHRVNPAAIRYANALLRSTGFALKETDSE